MQEVGGSIPPSSTIFYTQFMIKKLKKIPWSFEAARNISSMSLPVIISRILGVAGGFIGIIFVAQLGHTVLAASALAGTVSMCIIVTFSSLLFSVGILIGHAHGGKREKEIGLITRQSLVLGLISGIITSITIWHFDKVLLLLGQEKHLVLIAKDYFHATAWGIIPFFCFFCFTQLAVGISKPRLVTFWSIISLILSLILSYGLILGKLGFPKLGLVGLGWSGSITSIIMFIGIAIYLLCAKEYKKFHFLRAEKTFDWKKIKEQFNFSLPISTQIGAEYLAFFVATMMIGHFGESSLAAQQIVLQILSLLLMVPFGVTQVNGVLISQAFGAKNLEKIREIGFTSIIIGGIFGLLIAVFFILFPKFICRFYLDVSLPAHFKTVHIAISLLAIGGISQIFDILRVIASGALRGIYDAKVPMLVSVFISCLLSLPVGYVLGFNFGLEAAGVRLGFVFSFLLGAIILIKRFYRLSEKEYLVGLSEKLNPRAPI
jgi:multidrug resistance protein, MATE family